MKERDIPHIIHYCWFGNHPKPKLSEKCIKSWRKYCPDYEIIEWNEHNFDLSACPLYVRQAYEQQKWAFVTDYIRLKVVFDYGGIYMDTDVELKKPLDLLLNHQGYFGFEDGLHINTGLGFGAVKGLSILQEMMDEYKEIPFIRVDGSFDTETCPCRNTKIFLRHGLIQDNNWQILDRDILILPSIYLCPYSYETHTFCHSSKTISCHWFDASWRTKQEQAYHNQKLRLARMDRIIHMPNRLLMRLIGKENYKKLKTIIKRGK